MADISDQKDGVSEAVTCIHTLFNSELKEQVQFTSRIILLQMYILTLKMCEGLVYDFYLWVLIFLLKIKGQQFSLFFKTILTV